MGSDQHRTASSFFASMLRNWKYDALSGFLVFLIALPLCLGIAMASGYPPIAGILSAIVGGVVCTFISDSELTIKGPAAGLIVIAVGAVSELGNGDPLLGYKLALGVGVAAGVVQILFGLMRTGILSEFFPVSAVHGMLAAIGIIIAAKQVHTLMGVKPAGESTFAQILEIPHSVANMNPEVAIIGVLSLVILFGLPLFKNKYVRMVPAPMLVVLLAIPLGWYFDLEHEHSYLFLNHHEYSLGPEFLVSLPDSLFEAITHPDFSALATWAGWKFVVMFALVGSLESLLSARAIDLLDPYQRKTNLNRDMLAVGIANTVSASIGGLPMISEIVRSAANTYNGARTRCANLYHGLFLLAFVSLLPNVIHCIPLAALGAMLVYTGYRLASPREWLHVYHIGREQLLVFTTTVVMVLATDLLIGIGAGIAMKFLLHIWNGVPIQSLFRSPVAVVHRSDGSCLISVQDSAVFSSWINLKRTIDRVEPSRRVVMDLSATHYVDHTVMEKLHALQKEYEMRHSDFEIAGLEEHEKLSDHPHAARKKCRVTDLDKLKEVFVTIGCTISSKVDILALRQRGFDVPCQGARAVEVAGCTFIFAKDGSFLGVANGQARELVFEGLERRVM